MVLSEENLDRILHFTRGKLRVVLSWLVLVLLVVSIHEVPSLFGSIVMFLGAGIRFWASGYIDKEGRLSIAGPYSYVRNPLYLGSILIAVGAALTQNSVPLVLAFTFFSLLVHIPIIWAEERVLVKKFEMYEEYRRLVPRLFPWRRGNISTLLQDSRINLPKFSWARSMHNRGYEAWFVFLAIYALEWGVYFWKMHPEIWRAWFSTTS